MAHRPVGIGSSFSFTAGVAATSSAFLVQSNVLRVVAVGAAAHVAIGTNPSASAGDYYVPANQSATLAMTKASNRVAGIITGTTTVIVVPQGTQVPFGVGDYVSVTSSQQSYYNITHAPVISVDATSSVNGYYQERMTVNYNSSGILTAFNSTDAEVKMSQKVSAFGSGGSGALYVQQVQISGQA